AAASIATPIVPPSADALTSAPFASQASTSPAAIVPPASARVMSFQTMSTGSPCSSAWSLVTGTMPTTASAAVPSTSWPDENLTALPRGSSIFAPASPRKYELVFTVSPKYILVALLFNLCCQFRVHLEHLVQRLCMGQPRVCLHDLCCLLAGLLHRVARAVAGLADLGEQRRLL